MSESEHRRDLVRFLKALADESRLKIVGLLSFRAMAVEELAAHLGLESPTVSHHLRALFGVGLVRSYGVSHRRYYELNREQLNGVLSNLTADETLVDLAAGTGADMYERKVLATYLDEGHIGVLPMQPRKLRILLHWVASNLTPNQVYDAEELDGLLRGLHGDVTRLRRLLLDYNLLREEDGGFIRTLAPLSATEVPQDGIST